MMRMTVGGLALVILAGGAGSSVGQQSDLEAAKAAILRDLKDSESVRFEGLVRKPEAVCGFVNARNAKGGYSGKKPMIYVIATGRGQVLEWRTIRNNSELADAKDWLKYCSGRSRPAR